MGAILHFTENLFSVTGIITVIVIGGIIFGFYRWMMGDPQKKEKDQQ